MPRAFLAFAVAGLSLIAAGCNSGPRPPQPGTPAFYWAAAKSTYAQGDFLKTSDNLSQLGNSPEYGVRAEPWSIVMSAGLAKGYMNLAENFEYGSRANRANPTPFRRQVQQLRSLASTAAMQCAETVHKFLDSNKDDPVLLEFSYPTGSAAEPVQLQRVAKGMLPPAAEIEDLQRSMLRRGVLLTVTRVVGAGDDSAKALDTFKTPEVKVPRAVFLMAIAKALVDEADLYTPTKLDQPDRLNLLCEQATDALKAVPESKETKDLSAKIAKLRKPGKKT
jgi:hypothetical protein